MPVLSITFLFWLLIYTLYFGCQPVYFDSGFQPLICICVLCSSVLMCTDVRCSVVLCLFPLIGQLVSNIALIGCYKPDHKNLQLTFN